MCTEQGEEARGTENSRDKRLEAEECLTHEGGQEATEDGPQERKYISMVGVCLFPAGNRASGTVPSRQCACTGRDGG